MGAAIAIAVMSFYVFAPNVSGCQGLARLGIALGAIVICSPAFTGGYTALLVCSAQ
jgi:hypothetical protein